MEEITLSLGTLIFYGCLIFVSGSIVGLSVIMMMMGGKVEDLHCKLDEQAKENFRLHEQLDHWKDEYWKQVNGKK